LSGEFRAGGPSDDYFRWSSERQFANTQHFTVRSLLATDNYDAVLSDNLMPKINGIELCRVIRSVNKTIVILFCSGAVGEADKKAAFDAGAQGYICIYGP
jgi:CheY-like chemotaxis protein